MQLCDAGFWVHGSGLKFGLRLPNDPVNLE